MGTRAYVDPACGKDNPILIEGKKAFLETIDSVEGTKRMVSTTIDALREGRKEEGIKPIILDTAEPGIGEKGTNPQAKAIPLREDNEKGA